MSAPTLDDSAAGQDAHRRMALTWRWLNTFPVNPHPDLGREGPVCPYMRRALDQPGVRLFPIDARAGAEAFEDRVFALLEEFEQASQESAHPTYLVYFLVPYGLPEAELTAMMQHVHARVRPHFVQRGLLAGDFWPEHASRGLHSESFRPFASPLPVFAIRNMVPSDLQFLAGPASDPAVRLEYLGYYRTFFGDRLPELWKERLTQALAEASATADTDCEAVGR